jgi:transcriptional regulator with XRE-family HTH domain
LMQESLGHRLRVMRAERGLSLREAARRAGVVKETISDIERGHTHPYDVTLAKLAKVYDVPLEELLEEPALAGKAEAPEETGQPAEESEEEQRIPSIAASSLEEAIKFIRALKEQREAEIEEVKQGAMPRAHWDFHLEADNKYLEIIFQAGGFFAFVEEVIARRRMTDFPVQRLCHEFSRHFSDFVKLADEAKALDHQRQSDIHVEHIKGTVKMEEWMHEQSPES